MRSFIYFSVIGALSAARLLAADAVSAEAQTWQTAARWHRTMAKAVVGTLLIDGEGIEFQSAKFKERWPFIEIHTFDLTPRELTLWTYQRRQWHEPGEREFHFTLTDAMPAEVAESLTRHVPRPVRDGVPLQEKSALLEIPAHRRTWSGGSNGTLLLKNDGIEYATENGRDSRSWRWSDIQTIANPNPYEFRVTAYREIVEFDLKQALPRPAFERLWDRLYGLGSFTQGSREGGDLQ